MTAFKATHRYDEVRIDFFFSFAEKILEKKVDEQKNLSEKKQKFNKIFERNHTFVL